MKRQISLTITLTEEEYRLMVTAAGGAQHVHEWLKTAALLAAKEVKEEGV